MEKKWIPPIIIYIVLFITCILVVYAVPSVRGLLDKTYVAEFGRVDISDEVSAFIVRDETVYVAAKDSEINRLSAPGKLVKADTRVVELIPAEVSEGESDSAEGEAASDNPEGDPNGAVPDKDQSSGKYSDMLAELGKEVVKTGDGYTDKAGYVTYSIDGAEAKFSLDRYGQLNKKDFESLKKYNSVPLPDRECAKGEPVFKIVSNSKWYLVFYLNNKEGSKYSVGRTVSVNVGGRDVDVKVVEVFEGEKDTRIALSCKDFFDGFFETRHIDTVVTVASADGLVLRDSSIVEKDGQKGVFVKNKLGEHKYRPISVKADNGQECVVYSDLFLDENGNFVETISTYDEIVAEPTEEDIQSLTA